MENKSVKNLHDSAHNDHYYTIKITTTPSLLVLLSPINSAALLWQRTYYSWYLRSKPPVSAATRRPCCRRGRSKGVGVIQAIAIL